MKRNLILSIILMFPFLLAQAQNIWINEVHYDNAGTDADEFIEVVLENPSGYNLADFSIVLYNGNNGASYDTRTLDQFTAAATTGSFRFYWFNYTSAGGSIQNGAPDGMALAYQGTLIAGQFLSYEGTLIAADGPAAGLTSVDIGVSESTTTPAGFSLQLGGTGSAYSAFFWQTEMASTAGSLNTNQNLGGTPDPEPTNYPTSFEAATLPFSIILLWTDAVGTQLPSGYLILGSDEAVFDLPLDGVPITDDPDLSDGSGALNIIQGTEEAVFENLPSNTKYYFIIFPYTNSGTNINYKTDGTPPQTEATTPNSVVLGSANFDDFTFNGWTPYDVSGDQEWVIDSIHGLEGSGCAKMSGYSGSPFENEDWLISPPMNFNPSAFERLSFFTAKNFDGPDLEVKISNDYNGTGDPNDFNWTDLAGTLSPGSWAWTPSGIIDISSVNGNVYVGFRYTSNTTEAATWELDNILITGDLMTGSKEPGGKKMDFAISPNPASEFLRINFAGSSLRTIEVVSLQGMVLKTHVTADEIVSLDCRELSSGIYIIRVTENGSASSVKKLIVQ